ncbi:MAG: Lrp/AsnC family transcriptional regulator [Candidatus Bathyarchaeia archaeon]|jgi:Lrp/AsnC family transcriptional regulator for asnA, asnC and gidA
MPILMLRSLDEIDVQILRLLQENARVPFAKIGNQIGLTEGAVRARVKRLLKNKVIERFTISLNQQLTGERLLARVGVDANPSDLKKIAAELAEFDEVYFLAVATGTHDILVDVLTDDIQSLKKFLIDKLGKIQSVRGSDTSIVMDVYKWRGAYHYKI